MEDYSLHVGAGEVRFAYVGHLGGSLVHIGSTGANTAIGECRKDWEAHFRSLEVGMTHVWCLESISPHIETGEVWVARNGYMGVCLAHVEDEGVRMAWKTHVGFGEFRRALDRHHGAVLSHVGVRREGGIRMGCLEV